MAFERDVDLCVARLVRDVVEIAVRVGVLVVHRRRKLAFMDRESTHIIASIAPAAPKQCPITDFVEETASV